MDLRKFEKSQFKGKVQEIVRASEAVRSHKDNPKDVSFADMVKEMHSIELSAFLSDLGVDLSVDTISNLVTVPDLDVHWIIPEIFRSALLLGYRNAPIYPNIITAEEQMRGLSQIMPHINMSDASPRYVGEGETIPLGAISYGSKTFRIYKIGRGIKITDEVKQYSSLNVVSIFLRDFGLKLGHATDVLAIDCAINGEQADGSESAPVVGTTTGTSATKAYSDFLRVWIRMSRIGRMPSVIIGGETSALATLNLTEFKTPVSGDPLQKLTFKQPLPANSNYFIHGNVPDTQELIIDPTASMIKFNGFPLKLESERIVSNQTEAFYVSLQTGFAKLFRDATIILDDDLAVASYGLPTWMDVDTLQDVTIE